MSKRRSFVLPLHPDFFQLKLQVAVRAIYDPSPVADMMIVIDRLF